MNTLAARTLPEVLLSLAINLVSFFLWACIVGGIVGYAFVGVCMLLKFFFNLDKKKGKAKLEGTPPGFWIGWVVCTVITVLWVINYFRSN